MHNCVLKTPLYSNFALPWRCDIMEYSSINEKSNQNSVRTSYSKFHLRNECVPLSCNHFRTFIFTFLHLFKYSKFFGVNFKNELLSKGNNQKFVEKTSTMSSNYKNTIVGRKLHLGRGRGGGGHDKETFFKRHYFLRLQKLFSEKWGAHAPPASPVPTALKK